MSPRFTPPILLIAALFVCILSCAREHTETGFTEETVGGVIIRTYASDLPPETNPYSVESGVVYGTDQGAETYLLGQLRPIAVDSFGNLYAFDRTDSRVHRFHTDGAHLGSFGGRGDGPGEFRSLSSITVTSDALYCWALSQSRLSIFSRDGRFLGSVSIRDESRPVEIFPVFSAATQIAYLGVVRSGMTMSSEYRMRSAILLFSESGDLFRTVLDSTVTQRVVVANSRSYRMQYSLEFVATDTRPSYPLVWYLSRAYEFHLVYLAGSDSERIIRLPTLGRPVTTAMKEAVYLRYGSQPEDQRDARRHLSFPERIPVLANLQWDGLGRLWIRHYPDPVADSATDMYDVFDSYGTWLFRQELPAVSDRTLGTDALYGTSQDDEGNPVVRQFRLVRKASSPR